MIALLKSSHRSVCDCLQVLATARVPAGQSITMQGVLAGRIVHIGDQQVHDAEKRGR